jgi:hypothetical protein
MKIFADLHHGGLSYSLHLLFEKRLGWELFNPIGLDWREKGYWQYSQLEDTIHSYLDLKETDKLVGNHWERKDLDFEWTQKYLTFEQFQKEDIDVILCSVGSHEESFFNLRNAYKPKAKLIRQIGNWDEEVDFDKSKNLMISVGPFVLPAGINYVCYHQEFDLEEWRYRKPTNFKTIKTFINCFPDSVDYPLWDVYKKELPDFEWRMHGIGGTDGIVSPQRAVREAMADSGFIWHVKLGGEGFGHVIHNSYALGRPCIVKGSYYQGKMAEPLLLDSVTCIDLEKRSLRGNVEKIRFFSDPVRFSLMAQSAYVRFRQVCDFDQEEKALRAFLNRLI